MRPRLFLLLAVALVMWAIKRYYSDAAVDDLRWVLGPTARLVTVATGVPFEWEAGQGYLSRERLFLIEKVCAGLNFMIAAFGMAACFGLNGVSFLAVIIAILSLHIRHIPAPTGTRMHEELRSGLSYVRRQPAIVGLIILGGVLYTLGGVVYARRWPDPFPRWFGFHEVFHLLVVAASICHYLAIWRYVLPGHV